MKKTFEFHQVDDPLAAKSQIQEFGEWLCRQCMRSYRFLWARLICYILVLQVCIALFLCRNISLAFTGAFLVPIFGVFPYARLQLDKYRLSYAQGLADLSYFEGYSDEQLLDNVNYWAHTQSGTPYVARAHYDAQEASRAVHEAIDQRKRYVNKMVGCCVLLEVCALLGALLMSDFFGYAGMGGESLLRGLGYMAFGVLLLSSGYHAAVMSLELNQIRQLTELIDRGDIPPERQLEYAHCYQVAKTLF